MGHHRMFNLRGKLKLCTGGNKMMEDTIECLIFKQGTRLCTRHKVLQKAMHNVENSEI